MDYSRIGNYVHLHAENYTKYGIHMKQDGPSLLSSSMINDSIRNLKSSFALSSKAYGNFEELETRLNWLMKPPANGSGAYLNSGFNKQMFDEAWSVFQEVIQESFNTEVPPRIERELGTIEGIYMPGVHRIKTKDTQKTVATSKIINGITAIQNVINKASAEAGYSDGDITILNQLGKELETALNHYIETTNSELSIAGAPKRLSIDKAQPFIDIINKAVAYSTGVANAQRGDMWEDMIAVAGLIGKYSTREALKNAMVNAISGSVLGAERSPVVFNGDLFSEDAKMGDILGSTYQQKDGAFWYSRHQTQNKVDVEIGWNGSDINVSAKNVALSGPNSNQIKIVESMSLLMGLGNLGNPGLATHYINQHSFSGAGDSMYYETAQLVKISLVEQGLRGYKMGNSKADVFIINDNVSGRAVIVPMARLLEKIVDAFPDIEQFTSFSANPASISFAGANNFHPSGYGARITAILAAVHSAKVTIHLKPSIFRP